jgi:hypothetical protein
MRARGQRDEAARRGRMAFSSDGKGTKRVIFHLPVSLVGNLPSTLGNLDLVKYLLRHSIKTMELGPAPPFFSRSTVELLELGVFG